MKNKKGFVLPVFLVLMVALVSVISTVIYLNTVNVKETGSKFQDKSAFYISEAGIYKAIWYLTTDPADGGLGMDWRTSSVTEEFSGGSYTIIIEDYAFGDHPVSIRITSTGHYRSSEHVSQVLAYEDFADDLTDYTLSSGVDFAMLADSVISGSLFADGDVTIPTGAQVINGTVVVTEGHAITGDGEYVEGSLISIPDTTPDTTYYDNQIAVAQAGGPDVLSGYQTFGDLNLNGLTLYVNGGISIAGNIIGPGEIVAAQEINIERVSSVGENVKLIANTDVNIKATKTVSPDLAQNVVIFAKNDMNLPNSLVAPNPILIIGMGNVNVGNTSTLNGLIYGGNVNIANNTQIKGILICGSSSSLNRLEDSSSLTHKKYKMAVPPGFSSKFVIEKWL
ncbi:hypothetical protein ACFL37_00955 [Candidatus Margulisiibacteriota bacterium]